MASATEEIDDVQFAAGFAEGASTAKWGSRAMMLDEAVRNCLSRRSMAHVLSVADAWRDVLNVPADWPFHLMPRRLEAIRGEFLRLREASEYDRHETPVNWRRRRKGRAG